MTKKYKAVIINPWYTPYRIPVLREVSQDPGFDVTIIFCTPLETGREWPVPSSLPVKTVYLTPFTFLDYQDCRMFSEKKSFHHPKGLIKTLHGIKPDVIVALEFRIDCLEAFFYSLLTGCGYVTWSDMTAIHDARMGLARMLIRRLILSRSKAIIGSSTDTLNYFHKSFNFARKKLFLSILGSHAEELVQANGIIPQRSDWVAKSEPLRFVYVGGLIPRKGVDLLIRAFALLQSKHHSVQLTLVGNGPDRNALKTMVDELKLREHVIFKGSVPFHQIPSEMIKHDVLVLPTRLDVFALVVAEAIACGLPVVCSKYAGAANDLIKHNGVVVDPENTHEFYQALQSLISIENRRRMVKANQSVLPAISLETATANFVAALQMGVR